MSNKYHIAQTGKNAGKYVPCNAEKNCRIGGKHLTKEQAEINNIMAAGEKLLDNNSLSDKFKNFMSNRREKADKRKAEYDALPLYMKNPMFSPTDYEVCEKCGGRVGYIDPNSKESICQGH